MSKLNLRQNIRNAAERAQVIRAKPRVSTQEQLTAGNMLTRQKQRNDQMKSELNETLKDRSDNGLVMNPNIVKIQFKKLLAGEDIARKLGKLNPDEKLSSSKLKEIETTNVNKNASKAFGKYCKENLAGNRGAEHLAKYLAQELDGSHIDPEHQTLGIGEDNVTKGPGATKQAAQALKSNAAELKNKGKAAADELKTNGKAAADELKTNGKAFVADAKKLTQQIAGAGLGIFTGAAKGAVNGWNIEQKTADAPLKKDSKSGDDNDVANLDDVPDPEYPHGSSASDVSSIIQNPNVEDSDVLEKSQKLTSTPENGAKSITYRDVPEAPLSSIQHTNTDNKEQIAPTRKRDKFMAMFKGKPKGEAKQPPIIVGDNMINTLFNALNRSSQAPAPAPMSAHINSQITELKNSLRISELRLSIATTDGDLSDLTIAQLLNRDIDVSREVDANYLVNPTPQGVDKSVHIFNITQNILKNHPDYIPMDKSDYTPEAIENIKKDISNLKAEISALENPQAEDATTSVSAKAAAQNIANINGAEATATPTAPPLPTPPLPGQNEAFQPSQAAKEANRRRNNTLAQ